MNPSSLITSPENENIFEETSPAIAERVGANTGWLFLGRLGTHALTILVTILIARRLGEAVLGQYAFITSALFLLNGFTTLGTDVLLVREIAAKRDFSPLPGVLLLQLALSVAAVGLLFLVAPLLPAHLGDANLALRFYSLALFPLAFFTVFSAALRGKERMGIYSLSNVLGGILLVIAIWFFAAPGTGIVALAPLLLGAQVASGLLATSLALVSLPGLTKVWKRARTAIASLLRAAAPIALFGLLATIYQRTSLFQLATTHDAASTGWFSAALRVVEVPKFLHIALLGALLPTMSQAHAQTSQGVNTARYSKIFSASWLGLLVASGLAAIFLFGFAQPVISILFGERFAPSAEALRILCWILIPFTVSQYLGVRLLAAGREKQIVVALSIGLAALIVLNLIWIPQWGVSGAAWAAVAAETIHAVAFLILWNVKRSPQG